MKMKIEMIKLTELHPAKRNIRLHPPEQIKEYKRSIRDFEQTKPIVIDEKNNIIIGNGLYIAMKEMGIEEAACFRKSGLSENQKKKLMMADNRIFDLGTDDLSIFDEFLKELDGDFDIPGYSEELLNSLTMDLEETSAALSEYGVVDGEKAEEIRSAKAPKETASVSGNYIEPSTSPQSETAAISNENIENNGEIDPKLLTVIFIDEEAIFPCIEETVKIWRKKFLMVGAAFCWYCLEVRHFSCFNQLTADESFICWDSTKSNVWVRQPPSFAVRTSPCLKAREDTYQAFLPRITKNGIMLSGVRAAESVQRLQYMAQLGVGGKGITNNRQIYPIYDWKTSDVWLFLKEQKVDIPTIYLYMWQAGIRKGQLRVSQFFSSDTASCLVRMNEYYPDLMERVIRREPNAYLAALYWDSEMFGKRTQTRKALERKDDKIDYKAALFKMLIKEPSKYFHTEHQKYIAEQYRRMMIRIDNLARPRDYRKMYEALLAGDPKLRTLRSIYQDVFCAFASHCKNFRYKGGENND